MKLHKYASHVFHLAFLVITQMIALHVFNFISMFRSLKDVEIFVVTLLSSQINAIIPKEF